MYKNLEQLRAVASDMFRIPRTEVSERTVLLVDNKHEMLLSFEIHTAIWATVRIITCTHEPIVPQTTLTTATNRTCRKQNTGRTHRVSHSVTWETRPFRTFLSSVVGGFLNGNVLWKISDSFQIIRMIRFDHLSHTHLSLSFFSFSLFLSLSIFLSLSLDFVLLFDSLKNVALSEDDDRVNLHNQTFLSYTNLYHKRIEYVRIDYERFTKNWWFF